MGLTSVSAAELFRRLQPAPHLAPPLGFTIPSMGPSLVQNKMDWDAQSAELTEDSDAIDESTEASDVDRKFKNHLPSFDVISWYGNVVDCAPEPLLPLPSKGATSVAKALTTF